VDFDFHLHSNYSNDSVLTPKNIIKLSVRKGLSGVAVTDHNTILGGKKTQSISCEDFLVIVGAEIKTERCEVIGLFLDEEIKSRIFSEVIEEIKDQGGITVLPHPFKKGNLDSKILTNKKDLTNKIDLIEVLNARIKPELNQKALNLAQDLKSPMTAGSDAHTPFEIGAVRNRLPIEELDQEKIRKLLVNGDSMPFGSESPFPIQMLSRGAGRYKKEGLSGIFNSIKKMF
jgi:predicted metal-dependent phosphoesterase TrpH